MSDSSYSKATIKAFFRAYGFVRHHTESYAHCIQHIIPETVIETPPFEHETDNYTCSFRYMNTYLHKPGVIENDGVVTEIYRFLRFAKISNPGLSVPLC